MTLRYAMSHLCIAQTFCSAPLPSHPYNCFLHAVLVNVLDYKMSVPISTLIW